MKIEFNGIRCGFIEIANTFDNWKAHLENQDDQELWWTAYKLWDKGLGKSWWWRP